MMAKVASDSTSAPTITSISREPCSEDNAELARLSRGIATRYRMSEAGS